MTQESIVLNKRYKLLERAGAGGMATVFKGHDTALGRIVAVKLLHEGLTNDPSFLTRFRQEAHAAANLSHPNIVTVHDVGQDGKRHFIVMEYVEGKTLKDIVRRYAEQGKPMSIRKATELCRQISAGIGYAHRAGLVHCDVKPQNVIVTRDMRVKVADFGIALAVTDASPEIRSVVWGTPDYFAPEQAAGKPPTYASDVYSIGVIFYELLTNQLPFQADTPAELAWKHQHESPPPITAMNAGIPPELAQIVYKLLTKESSGRYRTAGQLERILTAFVENAKKQPPAMPASARQPIHNLPTQIYQGTASNQQPSIKIQVDAPRHPEKTSTGDTPPYQLAPPSAHTNRTSIVLGIIALAFILGLIPLWWLVYQKWSILPP